MIENPSLGSAEKSSGFNLFQNLVTKHRLLSPRQSLKTHLQYIFKDLNVSNKIVLDVGGGVGLLSFYSGIMGAKKTICLEPEFEGSSSGMIEKFNRFKNDLDSSLPVEHLPLTLQQFLKDINITFDIVILHNSINHLNEQACINLREDNNSYNEYKKIFSEVYEKMNEGGKIVIADCSNANFFNSIGLKSPFARTIEWKKHQHPKTWVALLKEVGFKKPLIKWTSPSIFGKVGELILGNSIMAYFTFSHFKFTMVR